MEKTKNLKKAVFLIILSAFFFAFMNLFVRLSGDVPIVQKTFFRNFFALIIASFTMIKRNRASRHSDGENSSGHKILPKREEAFDLLMRSGFGYLGVVCNFYALSNLPVADASLLNKMSPFFAIIFSGFLLKERADKIQWLMVLTAFAGVVFVLKPDANLQIFPSISGLIGGACAGLAYTFVRRASSKGTPGYYIVFFFSAFSCLCALPFVVFDFHPMKLEQLLYLLGAGCAAAGGQFSITAAYSFAPAKEVSIYDYSSVIFTAILSFIFMSEVPDLYSFIGFLIIIAAAIVMFVYNNRKSSSGK